MENKWAEERENWVRERQELTALEDQHHDICHRREELADTRVIDLAGKSEPNPEQLLSEFEMFRSFIDPNNYT